VLTRFATNDAAKNAVVNLASRYMDGAFSSRAVKSVAQHDTPAAMHRKVLASGITGR
jgi:hypothetical protein